ncbi:MAG: hypothetical protein M1829_000487 [Trizodia sp. TS-e1964]|nr:MAG: hypothetical protein M1829_000487 [Trizodia sp. TS-e1964]
MISAAVAELDALLLSMLSLKPPGVSGSKISSITSLCNANVQSESVLIQKLYTHFKKAPGTHKLGVLYVVDSVTRLWVDQARKAGDAIDINAPDGTFAAGVYKVTELLPSLMSDIIQHAPEGQKDRITRLVDIWDRGSTFPPAMLSSFKEKLNVNLQNSQSTTPPGTPPSNPESAASGLKPTGANTNTAAILASLANIAKQNSQPAAPPPTTYQAQNNISSVSDLQRTLQQPVPSSVNLAPLYTPIALPVNVPSVGSDIARQFPGLNQTNSVYNATTAHAQSNPLGALSSLMPPVSGGGNEALQQQILLIQVLAAQGVPQDQWGAIITALGASANQSIPNVQNQNATANLWPAQNNASNSAWKQDQPSSRNRNDSEARSPPNHYPQRRSRSRSPVPSWGREREREREASPPRRRNSPTYGEYNGESPKRGSHRDGGDRYERKGKIGPTPVPASGSGTGPGYRATHNFYRQRSPIGRRGVSPSRHQELPQQNGAKWMDFDRSIGEDNIKVLSRTLFVGGVTITEDELRSIFSNFGVVQTCIVNVEKRHGFIKMISRAEALKAKEGMDNFQSPEHQLRTRWGVGFGPRDCSDYQTGISIIPIARLTDADRKWMVSAEFGGSGGKPIEGGLVVEEPDIEIGAGVSSKGTWKPSATAGPAVPTNANSVAISRRMDQPQENRSNNRSRGGRQLQQRYDDQPPHRRGGGGRDRHIGQDSRPQAAVAGPAVPGFGFQFEGLFNGMQGFPQDFQYGQQLPQQQQQQQFNNAS